MVEAFVVSDEFVEKTSRNSESLQITVPLSPLGPLSRTYSSLGLLYCIFTILVGTNPLRSSDVENHLENGYYHVKIYANKAGRVATLKVP